MHGPWCVLHGAVHDSFTTVCRVPRNILVHGNPMVAWGFLSWPFPWHFFHGPFVKAPYNTQNLDLDRISPKKARHTQQTRIWRIWTDLDDIYFHRQTDASLGACTFPALSRKSASQLCPSTSRGWQRVNTRVIRKVLVVNAPVEKLNNVHQGWTEKKKNVGQKS